MATIPFSRGDARGEAKFFFIMACVMAFTIVAGFSLNAALGRSSFDAPWVVHLHAFVMMGWVALYVAQNGFVFAGNMTLHRKLGWLGAILIPAVVIMGLAITRFAMQERGGPPFFDQNQFVFSNQIHLLVFSLLAGWAIVARKNTGWHRRLMYVGFAVLTGPGTGRLLPMPFLIPYAWWANVAVTLIFPLIGILADKRRYGSIHSAWFWGVGLVLGAQVLADLIAYSDMGLEFTRWYLAGTPGAERQMEAFFPPA